MTAATDQRRIEELKALDARLVAIEQEVSEFRGAILGELLALHAGRDY